jgi:transglutaminase-like putative cysteine protease
MNFRVNCQLEYTLRNPATFFFAVRGVAAGGQHILSETLITKPFVQAEEFTIAGGMSRITRLRTLNPGTLSLFYQADVSTSYRIVPVGSIAHDGPAVLNPDAVPLLFPSRYCQSDRLRHHAQDLFGHLKHPYEIAAAASDWIYENIAYVSGSSGETSSAMDTFENRSGVCRDFAHLGIAFCRAMNVPARYISCYACQLNPPDFHACFEVFVDGWWYAFDATHLAPLNGLIRIATGRDAADTAVCTIFGNPELTLSSVWCIFTDASFIPITRDDLARRNEAIVLL